MLLNSLMHRSYEIHSPVKFYQFSDRLLIENPGGLYGNANPDNFPNISDYRNLVISEAMRVAGYVNRFNRGIATAEEVLSENGNPAPVFNFKTQWVFGVTLFENPLAVIPKNDVPVNVPLNVPLNDAGNSPLDAVLGIIAKQEGISAPAIAKIVGKDVRTIKRYIAELKKAGKIEYRGSAKTGGYFVHW
jgi:ATP-dependent DNA helicase RecG